MRNSGLELSLSVPTILHDHLKVTQATFVPSVKTKKKNDTAKQCLSPTLMIFYGKKKKKKIPLFSPHPEVSTTVLWHMLEAPFVRPEEEIQKSKSKRREKQRELSSEASQPIRLGWTVLFFFFATAVAWVTLHRPRWPSTISNRQSKWEPLISSSPPLTPPSL